VRPLSIAIAGCGPCGLAAALLLERQGHSVTLFERFAEPQPIGSGLMIQPTGLAVLRKLGLADTVLALGARVDRLHGTAGGRTVLDVPYAALGRPERFGIGIHRSSLFSLLYKQVQARPIALHTGKAVTGSSLAGEQRHLLFGNGTRSDGFDLVVDALGTWSPLVDQPHRPLGFGALWATLEWPQDGPFAPAVLAQRYERASKMVGVLPTGTGEGTGRQLAFFWSLRGDRFDAWQRGGLGPWKLEVERLWPETAVLLAQISDPAQLTFARYAHRTVKVPAAKCMIHLGDAWHCASPQLGQGANMALLDAFALSVALEQSHTVDEALARAVSLRRHHVLVYQALTWFFTPVYQSDSRVIPFFRDRLVAPLSRIPALTKLQAAMVSGLVGRPLAALGL